MSSKKLPPKRRRKGYRIKHVTIVNREEPMEITHSRFGSFRAKGPASQVMSAWRWRTVSLVVIIVVGAVVGVPKSAEAMSYVKRLVSGYLK